jgi:peroxiredoxin
MRQSQRAKHNVRDIVQHPIDFPLPPDLPVPGDDGAAKHLLGMLVPHVCLPSTAGRVIDLSDATLLRTAVYCYPMTGVPGRPLPEGWDQVPGARGCTPQTCGFRDHFQEFMRLGTTVFGISTQSTEYQREMAARLHVPFQVLSDENFELCDALRLPTFRIAGMKLMKRLTMIIREGRIEHVFYPVFPPDRSATQVLDWLQNHPIPG